MSGLVPFLCPDHGWRLDASPKALVTCGQPLGGHRCMKVCAPEGVDPEELRKGYFNRQRQRRFAAIQKR